MNAPTSTRLMCRLLTILPIVALAALMIALAVDIPFYDQWAVLGRVERMYAGELTLDELTRPHHEHWMPVPFGIMLLLARLTNWNLSAELFVNFAVGIGTVLVMLRRARMVHDAAAEPTPLLLPTVSLVTLSLCQHGNWLWGLQMGVLLSLFGTALAMHLLCCERLTNGRLALAAGVGLLASSSQFQGNLCWPLGLLAIYLSQPSLRAAAKPLAIWAALTALVAVLSYARLQTTENTMAFTEDPLGLVQFVLTYIGAPVVQIGNVGGTVAGLAGVALAGWLLVRTGGPRKAPFAVALLLFSLGSALITGVGRLEHGVEAARLSRYVTFATPFWVGLSLLVVSSGLRTAPRRALLATTWVLVAINSALSLDEAVRYANARAEARAHLVEVRDRIPTDMAAFAPLLADPEVAALMVTAAQSGDALAWFDAHADETQALLAKHGLDFAEHQHIRSLHSDSHQVRTGLVVLKQHGLSLFREE